MITFGTAHPADREAVRTLWLEAFPEDTSDDVETFLRLWFTENTVAVAREGDRVVSMLFLLPQPLCIGDAELTAGYVYAGATQSSYRGQGLYRRLLGYVAVLAVQNGMSALFLHPADEALADSYRRMGFTVPMTCGVCRRFSAETEWEPLTALEYRSRRRQALCRTEAYVDWSDKALDYTLTWCRAVKNEGNTALLGERDGRLFAWECFGALPPLSDGGRSTGCDETVGLLRWLSAELTCPRSVYMGYGWE